MSVNVRKKAVLILMNIEKNSAYTNIEMNKLRSQGEFSVQDIRFIGELVNGVVRHKLTIDYVISIHSSTRFNKIAPYVLAVLRTGVYQLLFMDKVPESAAVNESVKLIKKSSVSRLAGFVNAVLRAVKKDDINSLGESDVSQLSIKYSFPKWLLEHWESAFGFRFTSDLVRAMNEKPELCIRCNNLKTDMNSLKKILSDENIAFEDVRFKEFKNFNSCLNLGKVTHLSSIDAFENGFFYIQDAAAALAAYVADPAPGDMVIDMCAAPGGKSIYMAELMRNKGKIISCDIYDHKIRLINDNALKYGANIIDARNIDATVFNQEFENLADKVLCDVPCSGFGIIRKKPDIKYAREKEDIHTLSEMSLKILDNAARYVKRNGVIVFSTCTIEPEENENVCMRFLEEHNEFALAPIGSDNAIKQGYKTFYPHIDNTDGFFVAKFIKTE